MTSSRRGPLQGRRAAALVFGLFVAAGLVLVFGGTISRSNDIEARAERLRAENLALEARVAAGDLEFELVGTDEFIAWQARAYGTGAKGETIIVPPNDAPSPEPIVPLGAGKADDRARAPLDAWLELLFGG